jgi:hypothetical protein
MTVEAVVADEKLRADTDGALVSFIGAGHKQRFCLRRKPGWQVFRMLDEAQAVTSDQKMARGILSRSSRRCGRRSGFGCVAPFSSALARNYDGRCTEQETSTSDLIPHQRGSLAAHSENTNSSPPQLVHLAMSGRVVPRSRTSYGKFAATSPAMRTPMSPPIPA